MNSEVTLIRKRLIPMETVVLKDDIVISSGDFYVLTKWNTLKPKRNFSQGMSCYFIDKGIKLSKLCAPDGSLYCWYCDIVEYNYDEKTNTLTTTDLLADVKIFPDGRVKVVDLDELADALEQELITKEQMLFALRSLDKFLNIVYSNSLSIYTKYFD